MLLQDPLGATHVVFTYAGHTGIDSLPAGQSRARGYEHGGGRKTKSCCLFMGGTKHATAISGSKESSSLVCRDLQTKNVNEIYV